MPAFPTSWTRRTAGKTAVVALLIVLVLGLELVGSSQTLHQRLCPNAAKLGDPCAVAAFAGGVPVGSSTPAVLATAVLLVIRSACGAEVLVRATPLFRLSPCRAPPATPVLPG